MSTFNMVALEVQRTQEAANSQQHCLLVFQKLFWRHVAHQTYKQGDTTPREPITRENLNSLTRLAVFEMLQRLSGMSGIPNLSISNC
jgi:hypothetical protein